MSARDMVMGSCGTSAMYFTVLHSRLPVVILSMEMLHLHSDVYVCTEGGRGGTRCH